MKITKAMEPYLPFRVVRDSKEQAGTGWKFRASSGGDGRKLCAGTVVAPLDPGDYTIEGLEHVLRVERKGSVNDLVNSIATGRMASQLARLAKFRWAYLVMEFDLEEVVKWHAYAGKMRARGVKVGLHRPDAAFSALMKLHFRYPSVHFVFAGKSGPDYIRCLFKRVLEEYARDATKLL